MPLAARGGEKRERGDDRREEEMPAPPLRLRLGAGPGEGEQRRRQEEGPREKQLEDAHDVKPMFSKAYAITCGYDFIRCTTSACFFYQHTT